MIDRRSFLLASAALTQARDADPVHHVLATVDHQRLLLKASFRRPLRSPRLRVGGRFAPGVPTDSDGLFWTFDLAGLTPSTSYELQLLEGRNRLSDAWMLRTFPHPSERVSKFRLLVYTCAGGHPVLQLPNGNRSS